MTTDPTTAPAESRTPLWLLIVAWVAVSLPLAWGVYMTVAGRPETVHVVSRSAAVTVGPTAAPGRARRCPGRARSSRP